MTFLDIVMPNDIGATNFIFNIFFFCRPQHALLMQIFSNNCYAIILELTRYIRIMVAVFLFSGNRTIFRLDKQLNFQDLHATIFLFV